jgi:hypothetical protein
MLVIIYTMRRALNTDVPQRLSAVYYESPKVKGWRDYNIYRLASGHVVTVFEDITEKMKSMEALRNAEERFRTVADFTYDWETWGIPDCSRTPF